MSEPRIVIYRVALFVASLLFLVGIRALTKPETARKGLAAAVLGMLLGVAGTLLHQEIIEYQWIVGGAVLGIVIGIPMGLLIPMTKMPERVALSLGFGSLAVTTVGVAEFLHQGAAMSRFAVGAVGFEVLLGAMTFTGSLMAFGKLSGTITGRAVTFPGNNLVSLMAFAAAAVGLTLLVMHPGDLQLFVGIIGIGLLLGLLVVLPIGGADMPVIICLFNAYAGLAAAASGFVLDSHVLIICGALDGGSGVILAIMMSKAMNRSFANVLFGAFGSQVTATAESGKQTVRQGSAEDAGELLKLAGSVIFVPGYGMAVGQAQHAVRDLANALAANGARVRYAIHPVAGRMPGHMNVLLAEANVPYDQLYELESVNDEFAQTDVVVVVGANDVVNPAARSQKASPIYGMPILNADYAKSVIVLKRGMAAGFAGIDNDLFALPQTMMVFGDAKATLVKIAGVVKGTGH